MAGVQTPCPWQLSLLSAKSIPFPSWEEKCLAEKCVSAPSRTPAHTYKFWLTSILFFKESDIFFLFCFITNKNKKIKKKVAIFFSASFS